jgi:hypothetical protein
MAITLSSEDFYAQMKLITKKYGLPDFPQRLGPVIQ